MDVDPSTWTPWTYFLYGFALYCAIGLVWFWFRFDRLERAAHAGGATEVQRFNRALQGWPQMVYAKMLGKRPLHADKASKGAKDST